MAEYISRYIEKAVSEDVKRKMVFIGGPRQAGKATLAKHLGLQILKTFYISESSKIWFCVSRISSDHRFQSCLAERSPGVASIRIPMDRYA